MDDSCKTRVEKIFGSLTGPSSQPPPSIRSNLWSLTDGEVQKREWRRGDAAASDRDNMPCSSSFDKFKKNRRRSFRRVRGDDVGEVEDDEEEEESDSLRRREVKADHVDEWDIRSSIGLDRTLDNEEEEDEYDKVASGRDNGGRIYMSSINNQEAYLNIHNVIPDASYGCKDRRANYMAAKMRLQEDDNEARNLNSTHNDDKRESRELGAQSSHISASESRSILKRKDISSDSRSSKRVRFDPSCNIVSKEESYDKTQAISMDSSLCNNSMADNENTGMRNLIGVPDYMRNPSKYTCYSFDSSADVEEKSNTQNCVDILNMVKIMKSSGRASDFEGASSRLPKSVTFVPKKKGVEPGAVSDKVKLDENGQYLNQMGLAVGIAAGESQESEADALEEDEPRTDNLISAGNEKTSRKYRMKLGSEESTP